MKNRSQSLKNGPLKNGPQRGKKSNFLHSEILKLLERAISPKLNTFYLTGIF